MASMSPESQHKVEPCASIYGALLRANQLLAASLEEADPTIYQILQKVNRPVSQ